MSTSRLTSLLAPLALLAAVFTAACDDGGTPTTGDEDYLKNVEKTGGASQKWIYQGPMPKLEQPAIVVSLKSHTARVTGLLPASFTGNLPFYAIPSTEPSGRVRVNVVYPVATGAVDPSTGKAPMAPGHYSTLWGVPFTPTNDKAAWGGFPFMKYHASRGLAFHGPITSQRNAETGDWEWHLIRGPVSHGCERMAGEHVVELAHMLGMNMAGPHKSGDTATMSVSVDVITEWDQLNGKFVDVDYPALASVKRPKAAERTLFPTWDSNNLPNLVCAYDASRPLDGHHCDNVGLVKQDLTTGEMLVDDTDTPWIGSACSADADCKFQVDGVAPTCRKNSAGDGYCTVACQGYCDDAPGAAPTFCGKLPEGGGTCMAKAATENNGCADLDGTSAKQVERFVGTSGASAKVATVCSF